MAIIDVVKYNGGSGVYAWKFPNESLSTWTRLIVSETQEAVFFKDGIALDVFPAGSYVLDTENVPLLTGMMKLPFGGRSPFSAEIWFVNKAYSLDIKWGTATPVQVQDPRYGIFIPLRSFGQFGIKISDAKKFLLKLAGTAPVFDREYLTRHFRGVYLTKVKDSLSSYLIRKKVSILEINAYLEELSLHLQERIKPAFDEYGIELVNFYINDISVPEEDPAVRKLKNALAKKAEMEIIGYDYQQERSFDTLEGAAKSSGAGGIIGAGMGAGMGIRLGEQLSRQTEELANKPEAAARKGGPGKEAGKPKQVRCSACGHDFPANVKFCPQCGMAYNPCPQCGADMPEGSLRCGGCGYALPGLCPSCAKPVLIEGARYCPECGKALGKVCPDCQKAIDPGTKFCPACGRSLEEAK